MSGHEKGTTPGFCDAFFIEDPEPTISYRSHLTVYEESFIRGRFVGRGWNGAGFMNFYDGRLDPQQHFAPQAFWLELDGQLLASNWVWAGFERLTEGRRIHVIVTLKHDVRPVTVRVHTLLDGTPILARWLEVMNAAA
jgi:hypothetical protein